MLNRLSNKNENPKVVDKIYSSTSFSISSFKLLEINKIIKDNNKFIEKYNSKLSFFCEIIHRCYNRGYIWGNNICILIDKFDNNIFAISKINTDFGLFNIDDICIIKVNESNKLNIYNINDENDLFFLSIIFCK